MKKKIVNVLLSAAVITTMMFSVTACGSKADDTQNTVADAPVETRAAADANAVDETKAADADDQKDDAADANAVDETKAADADDQKDDAADGAMSLEEWTETDLWAEVMAEMSEGMEEEGMALSYEVDGDVLILVCQFDEQFEALENLDDDSKEMLEEVMGSAFEEFADVFETLRDGIIDETGNENVVLRVEYRTVDDSVIYSQEF